MCAALNLLWQSATNRGWINLPAALADIVSILLVVVGVVCLVVLVVRSRASNKHAAETASLGERG